MAVLGSVVNKKEAIKKKSEKKSERRKVMMTLEGRRNRIHLQRAQNQECITE